MKVTSRDITALVRDTQVEMMRKRSAEPKESLIDALILDEMLKMKSLVEGEESPNQPGGGAEGSMSLDPSAFVDTSAWAGDLGMQNQQQPSTKRQTRPPPNKGGRGPNTPPPGEIASLEHMLEGGDRTGVHGKAPSDKKTNWMLIIIVMIVLAGGAATAVILLMT